VINQPRLVVIEKKVAAEFNDEFSNLKVVKIGTRYSAELTKECPF
jgi:hypothetical protein